MTCSPNAVSCYVDRLYKEMPAVHCDRRVIRCRPVQLVGEERIEEVALGEHRGRATPSSVPFLPKHNYEDLHTQHPEPQGSQRHVVRSHDPQI